MRHLLLALVAITTHAATAEREVKPWMWQTALVPDVGFDLDAATVIHVTNLDANGEGSLRDALWKKGPRVIVFDVGGVIDLKMKELNLSEPQVYVAGQTAPAPGITLIKGGISISADQSVIQHIAVRPGDAGEAVGSGWSPDGISTSGG
ncbi:MAG: hypothetical protein KDK97_03480, partial [Verrucomicrobiales bacterium]|nr:hypothetical protein [Verrucomicrobiales bacterium]